MKQALFLFVLILLNWSAFSGVSNPEKSDFSVFGEWKEVHPANPGLWLLTAKVTNSYTMRKDTLASYYAGSMKCEKKNQSIVKTVSNCEISAVIENQAEYPTKDFSFNSDSGEPVSITVSGRGSHSESSKYLETIDGKMISADNRDINVSGSALPGASIQFEYSADYKYAGISINIKAVGSDIGRIFYDEWKDYGGDIDNYGIFCSGSCDLSSDKNCKIIKTANGYQASWTSGTSEKKNSNSGTEYITIESNLNVTVVPYKEPDNPVITLIGCTELGVDENSTVVATAKTKGGTFRFWAEPGNLLTVESNGTSEAKIIGATPGHGLLYVEYTGPEGKTNKTSQPASCVSIESYNGGVAIPQIAFYDVNGKKNSGILTVPVKAQPADAVELVRFEPANPEILSAVGAGSEVTIQGIFLGKTTLQAKTKCGANTGPAVEVEVVNCDDETIARLEKMKKAAIENLVAATKDLQQHAGSKEFEKARDDLVNSAEQLLAKVGLTIVTGGKTTGVVTKVVDGKDVISKAIPLAAEIADKGSAFSDIIGSSNLEELGANVAKPASGEAFERIVKLKFGEATKELYGKSLGALSGLVEVGQAADRFYNNVGELYYHEELLEKFLKIMEKADSDLKFVKSRQQLCGRAKAESGEPEIPLADLPPLPDKPSPQTKPAPKPADPPVQEPINDEAQAEQPITDEEILVDPEPPVIPPRQVGLPFEPDVCGCNSSKNLTVSSKDFSTLGTGIKNLGECVENYKRISLTDYQKALTELSELTESLSSALQTDAAAFLVKAKESKSQLDAIVNRVKSYDEAGKAFLDNMEKCPETISTGMEIFKSVETITIDSVKTNY